MTLSTRVDPRVKFPDYALPLEISHYSKDNDRNVIMDNRELKYLCLPQRGARIGFNILEGFDSFVPPEDSVGIDSILKWALKVLDNQRTLQDVFNGAEFVTYRGVYCKIGLCPYEKREPLVIVATRYKGMIFLSEFASPEKEAAKANEPLVQRQASYAGYKFEGFLTTEQRHGSKTCCNLPVNPNIQYCGAFRGKVNGKRIFMVAEIDCADSNTNEYVELKTQRQLQRGSRQEVSFKRFKCLRVWLQSYLVNCKHIIFGLRGDDFVVRELFSLETADFPGFCREGVPPHMVWEPAVCLTFIDRFLEFVSVQLKSACDLEYFRFEFDPSTAQVTVKPEVMEERRFLREWFLQAVGEKFA